MTIDRSTSARSPRKQRAAFAALSLAVSLVACVAATPATPPAATPSPVSSGTPLADAAESPTPASTSAAPPPSPPAASATAALPLPPGMCPPAIGKAPPSGFEDDDSVPGPAELPIEDLDGDGAPEIVVSFPASFTERGILVLKKVAAPACYEVLYQGVGEGAGGRKTKTKGFADLSVLMLPITSNGRGMAMAIAKFNGKRYRLERVEKCAGIDGKKLPAKECNAILAGYDDAARGGPP